MDNKERTLKVLGGVVALATCIAGWLALPQIQRRLGQANPTSETTQQPPMISVSILPLTYTPLPTYTQYPTYTISPHEATQTLNLLNPTVIPTITSIPSPTLPPNTSPDSRLKVGDTWKQDGFYLTLEKAELGTYQKTGTISLSFSVANHTGDALAVSLDQRDVVLEASNGTRFKPAWDRYDIWQKTIPNGAREEVWFTYSPHYIWWGDYFSPNVTYILITVRNWSRISEAVWQIDIQH
jgi:hypothetical protein